MDCWQGHGSLQLPRHGPRTPINRASGQTLGIDLTSSGSSRNEHTVTFSPAVSPSWLSLSSPGETSNPPTSGLTATSSAKKPKLTKANRRSRTAAIPHTKTPTVSDSRGTKGKHLNCPYFIRDPNQFWDCSKFKIGDGSRLKQHLSRVHDRPYCERCFRTFSNDEAKTTHQGNAAACVPRRLNHPCMSKDQRERLSSLTRGDDPSKWYTIWDILFPGEERRESRFIYMSPAAFRLLHRIQQDSQNDGLGCIIEGARNLGVTQPDKVVQKVMEEAMIKYVERLGDTDFFLDQPTRDGSACDTGSISYAPSYIHSDDPHTFKEVWVTTADLDGVMQLQHVGGQAWIPENSLLENTGGWVSEPKNPPASEAPGGDGVGQGDFPWMKSEPPQVGQQEIESFIHFDAGDQLPMDQFIRKQGDTVPERLLKRGADFEARGGY